MPLAYLRIIRQGRLPEDSETVPSCGLYPDQVLYVLFDSVELSSELSEDMVLRMGMAPGQES